MCGPSVFIFALTLQLVFMTKNAAMQKTATGQNRKELDILNINLDSNGLVNCSPVKGGPKIRGGSETNIGEVPWMAGLRYRYKSNGTTAGVLCGGALITNRYVLTAAHCLQRTDITLDAVLLGEWDLSQNLDCYSEKKCAPPVEIIGIKQEISHDLYDPATQEHDIALIELSRNVTFTDYVRPICLPPKNLPRVRANEEMTVSGWGITENKTSSNKLLKTHVTQADKSTCESLLNTVVTTRQVCAGNADSDACNGDSGGPLVRQYYHSKGNHWFLVGLVSFGGDCRVSDTSITIYTRVGLYKSWINREISSTSSRSSGSSTSAPSSSSESSDESFSLSKVGKEIEKGVNTAADTVVSAAKDFISHW